MYGRPPVLRVRVFPRYKNAIGDSNNSADEETKKRGELKEIFDESGILCSYTRLEPVCYLSINLAAEATGKARATVTRAARGLEVFAGPKGAQLYRSAHLLEAVMTGER